MSDSELDSKRTNGQNIRKAVHKKCSFLIKGFVAVGFLLIAVSVIGFLFGCAWDNWFSVLSKMSMLEDLQNFVSAIHTVLGAAVIFYYSVKDKQNEGIPPRVIMSYSFGSWAVPILLLLSTIMVIYVIVVQNLSWTLWTITGLAYTIITQIMCIGLILISTSYNYSLHVICNAEISQFKYLFHEENSERESAMWVYMIHHIEQAVKSDDLMGDRMVLSEKLLRTPFYVKQSILPHKLHMDFNRIYLYYARQYYEYYYNSLLPAFNFLSDKGYKEERMKMYQLLYEFIQEVDDGYCQIDSGGYEYIPDIENLREERRDSKFIFGIEGKEYRKCECMKKFLALVSAVINAALFANLEESEEFCHYILNTCIMRSGMREYQIRLYFLYQELLFHTRRNAVKLDNVKTLKAVVIPQKLDSMEQKMYEEVWEIWCQDTSLGQEVRNEYLYDALDTLVGRDIKSEPITYIITQRKKA